MLGEPEKPDAVVFDCAGLDYISSTGLRIVLKYKKQYNDLRVINVSNDVYNVFEITGFTNIMDVERAKRRVDLTACTLLAQGGNGAVYRISDEEIVKVQLRAGSEQMMHDEKQRSKEAFVLGVPTSQLVLSTRLTTVTSLTSMWRRAARYTLRAMVYSARLTVRRYSTTLAEDNNVYNCVGSGDDRQYVTWHPVETPSPDFHRPEYFRAVFFNAGVDMQYISDAMGHSQGKRS